MAKQYAKLYPANYFIGITGSVGKTVCVQSAKTILSQKFQILSTEFDLNSDLDIPKTILKLNPTLKKVILEMGIENKGEMDFYLSLIHPKTVVFTKIAYDHSESLGELDDIIMEKGKLIKQLDEKGLAILNFDDSSCKKLAKDCKGSVLYYGTDPNNCSIWAGNIQIEDFKTTFELNLGVERVKVNFPYCGLHLVYPAMAAAALGVINNIPLTKIKLALEAVKPLEHLMQVVAGPNGSVVLDDTINSSSVALDSAIDTLQQINARRRVLVLGEMRNLGKYSDTIHRQIAQKIFKEKIDFVFLGQGNTEIIAAELKSLGFWEERVENNLQNSQIVSRLLNLLRKGDLVLIKGAYSARLDEIVKRISKKT
ncbi:hypothetical protein HYW41_02375 [Candidatus Daviesbacteria bacterium]|nr:hypothetical protein [Candidatus Daviesbacteria bacterium]